MSSVPVIELALFLSCQLTLAQGTFDVTVNFDGTRGFLMSAWPDVSIMSMDQMIEIAHLDGVKDPFATGNQSLLWLKRNTIQTRSLGSL